MDFRLTEREELLRKTIRDFSEKRDHSLHAAMEETGNYPSGLQKKMGEMGFWCYHSAGLWWQCLGNLGAQSLC